MLNLNIFDRLIAQCDGLIKSLSTKNNSSRQYPAGNIENEQDLSHLELKQSISYMRINHGGEVCAQALYHGQAIFSRNIDKYNLLMKSAEEENDHLKWCRQRLYELGGKPSIFNPIWYIGSFTLGTIVGAFGDNISLGFLSETERQVGVHLTNHLNSISVNDKKSRAILEQMRIDELEHATKAECAGAAILPFTAKFAMKKASNVFKFITAKI